MKTCQICGVEKPLDAFHRLKKSPDGRQSRCKECVSAYMREYHQRNAQANIEKAKAWRLANPERKKLSDAKGRLRRREIDIEGERQKARDWARAQRARKVRERSDTPCECGCGERTFFSATSPLEPLRFITGHNNATLGRRFRIGPDHLPEDRGFETACWIWQHGKNDEGYGQVQYEGRTEKAYRWMYEQAHGPVPPKLELHHLCEQKACVNPEHLTPLTRLEHRRIHTR